MYLVILIAAGQLSQLINGFNEVVLLQTCLNEVLVFADVELWHTVCQCSDVGFYVSTGLQGGHGGNLLDPCEIDSNIEFY